MGGAGPAGDAHGRFRVAAAVPIAGAAADRNLAPTYPGISESETLADWDPPFPIDLRRVRRVDEDYWKRYRTTPKAFVPLDVGTAAVALALRRSHVGARHPAEPACRSTTRATAIAARLRDAIDPLALGCRCATCARTGLAASRGATDFGEYFTYFSFFLVDLGAAAGGAVLQARRRAARARGRPAARGRLHDGPACGGCFCREGSGARGRRRRHRHRRRRRLCGGDDGRAPHLVGGRRRHRRASLHVSPVSLGAGAAGASPAALACIWWTLRGLSRISERSLLAGELAGDASAAAGRRRKTRAARLARSAFGVLGAALMVGDRCRRARPHRRVLRRRQRRCSWRACASSRSVCAVRCGGRSAAHGWWAVSRLGLRNAAERPGRSVLAIAVIAAATFILISVDAFRRVAPAATDRHSGVGGYALLVELAAAAGSRSQRPRRPRALGLAAVEQDVADRAVSRAARRRCQLPEPVRAATTRASSARGRRSSSPAASRSRLARRERRRARESVAAAEQPHRRRERTRRAGDRRRQLDDLRAPQGARRRHRDRSRTAGRCGCASSPRSPTASFRAS